MIFRGRKVLDGTLVSIQERYGNDTIRVSAEGGVASVQGLPGVEQIRDLGQEQELRMARGCDPQEVLRALLTRTRVTSFRGREAVPARHLRSHCRAGRRGGPSCVDSC